MKRIITRAIAGSLATGLMGMSMQAMANDAQYPDTNRHEAHAMMRECMTQQKAANTGMSEHEMRKACKAQVKAQMDQDRDRGDRHDRDYRDDGQSAPH